MWRARDEGRHRGQTSTVSVPPEPPVRHPTAHTQEAVQRWRLVVRREPLEADQVQRAQQGAWEAGAARIRPAGRRPRRRRRAAPVRARGAALAGDPRRGGARGRLADRAASRAGPCGTRSRPRCRLAARLIDLYDVWLGEAALPGRVVASVYRATLDGDDAAARSGTRGRGGGHAGGDDACPASDPKGDRTVLYDLRPFLGGVARGAPRPGRRDRDGAAPRPREGRRPPGGGARRARRAAVSPSMSAVRRPRAPRARPGSARTAIAPGRPPARSLTHRVDPP